MSSGVIFFLLEVIKTGDVGVVGSVCISKWNIICNKLNLEL